MTTSWLGVAIAIPVLLMSSNGYSDEAAITTPSATPPPVVEPAIGANKPSVITYPSWKKRPTAEQFQREYSKRALRQNVEGRGAIRCIVAPSGSLTECKITADTPESYGFGEAAMKLAKYFVMYPKTPDGAPTSGAIVNIGIPFRFQ